MLTTTQNHPHTVLKQMQLFADLTPEERDDAISILEVKTMEFASGEIVLEQGKEIKQFLFLLEGKVEASEIDRWGKRITYRVHEVPEPFALLPFINPEKRGSHAWFVAQGKVKIGMIGREDMFRLFAKYPSTLKHFMVHLSECADCQRKRLNIAHQRNVRDRLVTFIFQSAEKGETRIKIPYNRVELADYLNVSRPALSAEISKMEKEGLLRVQRKEVILLQGLNPEVYYRHRL